MRAKRSKKYRKLMHQYELTFGFRAPYQVLVDSNFLRAVHSFKMDLVPALERTLQGKVKPFITKCSLAAVMESTPPQPGSRPNARPPQLPPPTILPLRYCSHNEDSKPIDETACLLSLLSPNADAKKNKEHYILATADPAPPPEPAPSRNPQKWKNTTPPPPEPPKNLLRRAARQIPGVPIIYVKRSVMILEPLSGSSEGVREGYERGKFKTGMLSNNNVTGKRKRDGGDDDDDDGDDGGNEGGEGAGAIKEKKKVKKVKGPNPLSVKKPKAKPKLAATGGDGKKERSGEVKAHIADVAAKEERPKETTNEEGESAVKTKRKRRHKSNKSGGEAGAGASAPSQPESAGAVES